MKRRALAVAVGALFIAPAAHAQITFGNEQLGTLQVYGKLYPQFGWSSTSGATQPGTTVSTLNSTSPTNLACPASSCPGTNVQPRTTVDVSNSYLGFRGERNLGTGLKAIWQIETALNFDNPDASTGGTNSFWATRNSFAGLSSTSFGTVKLGNMDTVYKEYGDTFSMFGISSGNFVSASNVLSHIGVGRDRSARFHERRTNSIYYESPTFANVTAGFMYGPDEAKTNGLNANLYSYGVKWDTERFYVSLHQEQHNDFFGGSNNVSSAAGLSNVGTAGAHSHDRATRLSAEIRVIPNNRIVLDIARLTYKETGQANNVVRFQSYEHTNWGIGYELTLGAWGFATQFLQGGQGTCHLTAGAGCTTEGLRGRMLTAGVRYRFDRQTFLYGIGAALQNDKSARYDNWSAADPSRGGEIKQLAMGISYTF